MFCCYCYLRDPDSDGPRLPGAVSVVSPSTLQVDLALQIELAKRNVTCVQLHQTQRMGNLGLQEFKDNQIKCNSL